MHPDNRSTIPTIAPNNMAVNIPRSAATEAAAFSCESVEFILYLHQCPNISTC